jgi:PHD/YefM family antitoxin component YafN of YafNO toxin-antitoxin module
MSSTYAVTVAREGRWWVITIPDVGAVTQARRLVDVPTMARELIAVSLAIPNDDIELVIAMEAGAARDRLEEAIDLAQTVDVVLKRQGHPAAVLVSLKRYDELSSAPDEAEDVQNSPPAQAGELAHDAVRAMRSRDREMSQARWDRIDMAVESSRGQDVNAVTAELLRGAGFGD